MKKFKTAYLISTGLLSLLMLMSAGMYFFKYEDISQAFTSLGYPTYLIYPLAIAKILGLVAISTEQSKSLKEWAYAGFLFDFVLAASAHVMVQDGQAGTAFVALVLLFVSYFSWKRQKG